jgi:hypothetical protein
VGTGPNCLKGKALNQRLVELSVGHDTTHIPWVWAATATGPVGPDAGEWWFCVMCVLPGDEVYSVLFAVFTRACCYAGVVRIVFGPVGACEPI